MGTQVSDQELGDAFLQSVEHGSYPQSEHVASASVSPAALPKLLEVVGKAREDTKVYIISEYRTVMADDFCRTKYATSRAKQRPTSMAGSPKPANSKAISSAPKLRPRKLSNKPSLEKKRQQTYRMPQLL
jgi:hypothetical protein